jgi:hypothetical protein
MLKPIHSDEPGVFRAVLNEPPPGSARVHRQFASE